LNQNDKEVVSSLKEKLVAIMAEDEQRKTVREVKFRSMSPPASKLGRNEQGKSAISLSKEGASPKSPGSDRFKTLSPGKKGFADTSLYDRFQSSQFGSTVGYLLGLNVHNIAQRKKLMMRKLNELDDKNRQKVNKLESLKIEL
jgi:hypothetical protein